MERGVDSRFTASWVTIRHVWVNKRITAVFRYILLEVMLSWAELSRAEQSGVATRGRERSGSSSQRSAFFVEVVCLQWPWAYRAAASATIASCALRCGARVPFWILPGGMCAGNGPGSGSVGLLRVVCWFFWKNALVTLCLDMSSRSQSGTWCF